MCKKARELSQIQDAFNPNPLTEKNELDEFYMNTSFARTGDEYSDFVQMVSMQLQDSTEVFQHKLFIGHPGCGKTTELYKLLQKTKEMNFASCMGRCDLELDSADIEYTDVLFLILDLLVRMAKEYEIEFDSRLAQSIYDYWKQDIELISTSTTEKESVISGEFDGTVGLSGLIKIMAQIKGVIKNSFDSRKQIRSHIDPSSSELVSRIQDVIEIISKACAEKGMNKIPLIILDGLDKIPLAQAIKIFRENGSKFSSLQVHLIVTFPISLTYSKEYGDIQIWFPNPEKLPMIKIKKWEKTHYADGYQEGIDTMRQIVEKRAELSLFEENVLDQLIQYTGGYIRDLFRCISKASVRARMRNSTTISMKDAEISLNNLESDLNGRYNDELIPIMRKIYNGEKHVNSSESMIELLQVGAVLEYNGERWCDLHPLVEKWLKEHGKIE